MSKTDNSYTDVYELLAPFGLGTKHIDIYLLLLRKHLLSALEISRELDVPRTQIYRLLEDLIEGGWVNQKLEDYGSKYEANAFTHIDHIITEKEKEIEDLRKQVPFIYDKLKALEASATENKTKVLYYKGTEGLKQVTWNSLRADKELLIFEIANMSAFLDQTFSEKVRQEFVRRNIHVREITNQTRIEVYTHVEEFMKNFWECRYVSDEDLDIKLEFLVYNDVYTIYHYKNNEIFCVEIYNPDLAAMQRQFFEYIWKRAKHMRKIDNTGASEVIEN